MTAIDNDWNWLDASSCRSGYSECPNGHNSLWWSANGEPLRTCTNCGGLMIEKPSPLMFQLVSQETSDE